MSIWHLDPDSVGGGTVAVDDDGVEVVAEASRLNFGDNLTVTDDGDGAVTIDGEAGADLSDADPEAPGTADPGTSGEASRADHVHPDSGGGGGESDQLVRCGQDEIGDGEDEVVVEHGGGTEPESVQVTAHAPVALGVTARDGTEFTVARSGTSGALGFDWSACFDLSGWQPITALGGNDTFDVEVQGVDYRVHVFTADGTFIVVSAGDDGLVDVLAVGGGGGGGTSVSTLRCGGGGGGGEVAEAFDVQIVAGTLQVVVGDGGVEAPDQDSAGGLGGTSSFEGVEAVGGGGGGSRYAVATSGASGGGGPGSADIGTDGASGTAGNDGGDGLGSGTRSGGGGGGAGTAGGNGANAVGGDGGDGTSSSMSGTATLYGGGGGGGVRTPNHTPGDGGAGGGGDGGDNGGVREPTAGTDGRGGGGGGSTGGLASAGGSGIVIIRYPLTEPEGS